MRKENKDFNDFDLDAALRKLAAKENAALPAGQWKEAVLKKAEEDDMPAAEPYDKNDLKSFRRRKTMRRMTAGLSLAAALVVILLGAFSSGFLHLGASDSRMDAQPKMAAAQEAPAATAAPAAPESLALPAPAPDTGASGSAAQAPSLAGGAAPAESGTPLLTPPSAGNAQNAAGDIRPFMAALTLTPEQEKAVDAVRNAPLISYRGADGSAEPVVQTVENTGVRVRFWDTNETKTVTLPVLYLVTLNPAEEDAPRYAVDGATFEVLGTVVED